MARGRLRMASGSQKGSSPDGLRVVSGWPQGRLRMASGPSTDGPRSFTDGPRFSLQAVHGWREFRSREAAMYHCTSRWQRGPPPRGWLSTDSPTGERTGGEPTGAHLLTNAGHRVFRWWPGCARTRPLSADRYWVGFPLLRCQVHTVLAVQNPVEIPLLQALDKVVGVPVVVQRQVPTVQTVQKTVEVVEIHRCGSWTCPLFSTTGAHGPDRAEARGDITVADRGQGFDLWERQCEKILLKHVWEKIPNWECLSVHRDKGLFLSVYLALSKTAWKKHNVFQMWKEPQKV